MESIDFVIVGCITALLIVAYRVVKRFGIDE